MDMKFTLIVCIQQGSLVLIPPVEVQARVIFHLIIPENMEWPLPIFRVDIPFLDDLRIYQRANFTAVSSRQNQRTVAVVVESSQIYLCIGEEEVTFGAKLRQRRSVNFCPWIFVIGADVSHFQDWDCLFE